MKKLVVVTYSKKAANINYQLLQRLFKDKIIIIPNERIKKIV